MDLKFLGFFEALAGFFLLSDYGAILNITLNLRGNRRDAFRIL